MAYNGNICRDDERLGYRHYRNFGGRMATTEQGGRTTTGERINGLGFLAMAANDRAAYRENDRMFRPHQSQQNKNQRTHM